MHEIIMDETVLQTNVLGQENCVPPSGVELHFPISGNCSQHDLRLRITGKNSEISERPQLLLFF